MAEFDPDAYLADGGQAPEAFDPDAYLASGPALSKGPRTRGGKRRPPVKREPSGPSLALVGDRATGFRQQVEETGMTPEERVGAVRGFAGLTTSLLAGPIVGGAIRGVAALPAVQRFAPAIEQFGRAVQSGGVAPNIPAATRVAGGATAGAASAAVMDPEATTEGAVIGAATPGVAKVARAFTAPKAPTTKQLKDASQAAYANAEAAKADVAPQQFAQLTYKLEDTLSENSFNPVLHPKAQVAVNAFTEQAKNGQPVTLNQLDVLRRVASKAAGSGNKDEARIGSALVRDVDEFIRANAPEAAVRELEKARDLYTRMSRSALIERTVREARSGRGEPGAKVKEKFAKLAQNERAMRQFTEAERDLIRKIAKGRFDISALEAVGVVTAPPRISEIRSGNLRYIAPSLGYTAAYGGLGTLGGGLVAGGGYASRAAANRLALARAEQLRALAAAGQEVPYFAPETLPQVFPGMMGGPEQETDFMAEQERINQVDSGEDYTQYNARILRALIKRYGNEAKAREVMRTTDGGELLRIMREEESKAAYSPTEQNLRRRY